MHESIEHCTRAYLGLVDQVVPARIEGLYLVGSVALGDFRPHQSDIDFIAVVSGALDANELQALASVHRKLEGQVWRPHFSGVYVTWDDIGRDPRQVPPLAHHHEGRFASSGGFDANPAQWLTLKTNPVAIRGPSSPAVWTDAAAVHEWTLHNLNSYWASWVSAQRRLVGGRLESLTDRGICWGVLGVPRLHYTLSTGRIISKTGAGDYARSTFDTRWHGIIDEALRLRLGGRTDGEYRRRPLPRRRQALDFMTWVIDDARARYS